MGYSPPLFRGMAEYVRYLKNAAIHNKVFNPAKADVVKEILDRTEGYGCDIYIEATGHLSSVDRCFFFDICETYLSIVVLMYYSLGPL